MYIPQDILFKISEYGQVHPDLSPEYIESVVHGLNPNFDWTRELALHMNRCKNELYFRYATVLKLHRDLNQDDISTECTGRRRGFPLFHLNIDVTTLNDQERGRILREAVRVNIMSEIHKPERQQPYGKQRYILRIPVHRDYVNHTKSLADLLNARPNCVLDKTQPTTYTMDHSQYMRGCHRTYSPKLTPSEKRALDLSLIREMLNIRSKGMLYDLGELIHWLEYLRLQRASGEMMDILKQSKITSMSIIRINTRPPVAEITCRSEDDMYDVYEYLDSIDCEPIQWITGVESGYCCIHIGDDMDRLVSEFLNARALVLSSIPIRQ